MSDLILSIKTSQSNNAPSALANGELAYSYSSNKLYIGQTDSSGSDVTVEYIGGKLLVDKVANLEVAIAALSGTGDVQFDDVIVTGTLRLSAAPNNSVLYTSANGLVEYATGSLGRVLLIGSNGAPSFDDLNGGTY